jgi:hypothetical protein
MRYLNFSLIANLQVFRYHPCACEAAERTLGVGMGFLPCEARPAINASLDNLTTPVLHLLSGAHL